MIRRETTDESGRPSWILISQVEHARLSGLLAQHWGANGFTPLVNVQNLLATITHHDDGWQEWEQQPQVDSTSGRPFAFTEMPLAAALEIWSQSIVAVENLGPLSAWIVAGHFLSLLEGGHWGGEPMARQWIEQYKQKQAEWLGSWQATCVAEKGGELAGRALFQLRFFDGLSLWFCCGEHCSTTRLPTPCGQELSLSPQEDGGVIVLEPWPLTVERLQVSVVGREVPAKRYASSAELAQTTGKSVEITWNLQAA